MGASVLAYAVPATPVRSVFEHNENSPGDGFRPTAARRTPIRSCVSAPAASDVHLSNIMEIRRRMTFGHRGVALTLPICRGISNRLKYPSWYMSGVGPGGRYVKTDQGGRMIYLGIWAGEATAGQFDRLGHIKGFRPYASPYSVPVQHGGTGFICKNRSRQINYMRFHIDLLDRWPGYDM